MQSVREVRVTYLMTTVALQISDSLCAVSSVIHLKIQVVVHTVFFNLFFLSVLCLMVIQIKGMAFSRIIPKPIQVWVGIWYHH